MKQFILNDPPNSGGIIHLYRNDYHYLVRVRRLRSGSSFDAVLPDGRETRVRVLSTADGILIGECEGFAPRGEDGPRILLFQGLPKGNKMDLIVRQAAEGAVAEVIPFESEYSVTKAAALPPDRKGRWERIIREARQQSGSTVPTALRSPCALEEALAYWEAVRGACLRPAGILLHQEKVQDGLDSGAFHEYLKDEPDTVALAIGPEGGFSPSEAALFIAGGFKPLVIGNTILRTETAALYGAAAVRIILLENQWWTCRKRN